MRRPKYCSIQSPLADVSHIIPIFNAADLSRPVIYGHDRHILKSKGYESQSFERKHATLFNCTNPDWVSAKKKLIGPVFASKDVLDHHAESIAMHTQRLLATVRGGQPCEMSAIGQYATVYRKKFTANAKKPFVSVWMLCPIQCLVPH